MWLVVQCKPTTTNIKMKLKIFVLSLACLSCLAPPASGSILALKAAAALGAVKGAALLGAGALAIKGAAIKGAIHGAAEKAASLLAAKEAAIKEIMAQMSQHKQPDVRPPVIIEEPAVVVPTLVTANSVSVRTSPPYLPSVSNSLSALLSSAHQAAQHKVDSLSSALAALHQPRPAVVAAPVVVESFRYPYPARFYPAPLPILHTVDDDCL